MRIAIMGTGGVGGYFGARLAAAGEDVSFIARGAHLEALRRDGLRVESTLGNVTIKPVKVVADPAVLASEKFDYVIVAVKLRDNDTALASLRPLVGPDTAVVSFQNGVGAVETLTAAFGEAAVLGGTVQIATAISAPGIIRHTGTMARMMLGEPRGGLSPRVTAFVEAGQRAGFDVAASEDIRRTIWEKFIFLAPFSGVATVTRLAKGPAFASPETRQLFVDAVSEVVAVARASGIKLPEDHAAKTVAFVDRLPAEMKPSLLHDLEHGKPLEVEFLSGAVASLGAKLGVPTPVHRAIYAVLKPHAAGKVS